MRKEHIAAGIGGDKYTCQRPSARHIENYVRLGSWCVVV
jgi:hypothetical protein